MALNLEATHNLNSLGDAINAYHGPAIIIRKAGGRLKLDEIVWYCDGFRSIKRDDNGNIAAVLPVDGLMTQTCELHATRRDLRVYFKRSLLNTVEMMHELKLIDDESAQGAVKGITASIKATKRAAPKTK